MSDFPTPLDSLPLLTMNQEGKVPPSRLEKASNLRTIFNLYRDADQINARNRALMLAQLGGAPPWDQSVLDAEGMNDTTNLNFGGSEEQLEKAMAPYYALVQTPERLVSLRTTYGPAEDRDNWEQIMAEEVTRTIRSDWDGFSFHTAKIGHHFIWDGIAFASFPDDTDWRYSGSGLGDYFVPRQSFASENEVEIIVSRSEYTVTKLYQAIKNPETAQKLGWDVEAVKTAIKKAMSTTPNFRDWEKWEDMLKNNDLYLSSMAPVIRVIHGFIAEFDGTVSHYITTEDDLGTEEFIYCSRQKFRQMSEQVVMFTYGLGVNAKTHGIRGLGYKIYAFEEQRNRSLSRMIDLGTLASSLMLKAGDENTQANAALTYLGHLAFVEPGYEIANFSAPDTQKTVIPVLSEMERLRNNRTSSYSDDNAFDGDQRKTKFEVASQLQKNASLSGTSLDFFCNPFDRLLRQVVRRMSRKNYSALEPGGREVADLRTRLLSRGVPLDAFYNLDHKSTRFVRSVGAGSASAKTIALQRVSELRPAMDDVGQQKLNRDLAVDAVGVEKANEYFPQDGQKRTPSDFGIAVLQNYELLRGNEVPVLDTDRHVVHAEAHLQPLIDGFKAVESGQAELMGMAQQMHLLFNHTVDHVEQIQGDPATMAKAAEFRQILQQVGEVISNGLRKAEAEAAKQVQEGQQPQEGQQGPSPEDIAKFEKHKAEIQMAREKFDIQMQQLLTKAAVDNQIKDANAAAEIARKNRKEGI